MAVRQLWKPDSRVLAAGAVQRRKRISKGPCLRVAKIAVDLPGCGLEQRANFLYLCMPRARQLEPDCAPIRQIVHPACKPRALEAVGETRDALGFLEQPRRQPAEEKRLARCLNRSHGEYLGQ